MPMLTTTEPYSAIFAILADHRGCDTIAPGAPGAIFQALDEMRANRAPTEHIEIAERLSTCLHRIYWAARQRNAEERQRLCRQIDEIWNQWLEMSPIHAEQSFAAH